MSRHLGYQLVSFRLGSHPMYGRKWQIPISLIFELRQMHRNIQYVNIRCRLESWGVSMLGSLFLLIRIEISPFALIRNFNFMATLFPSSLESATTLINAKSNFASIEWNLRSPESINLSGSGSSIASLIQSIHGCWSESFAAMTVA